MNADERSMIEGLFERLRQAETQSGPRDAEAEALIRKSVADQPAAPYLMAQVVLVQEQGLRNLQERVEELERELAERPQGGGGFLGGLFGGGGDRPSTMPARTQPPAAGLGANRFPPQSARPGFGGAQGQGGGFMAGALQTAMGVAGGVLLANAIGGLFAGEEAMAGEIPADAAPAEAPEETGDDEGLFGGFFEGDEDDF